MPMMDDLQTLCERGQEQLIATDYLAAESTLVEAERFALEQGDFDTLGRLYMPLQEARRQRRQRCGEGTVRLDLLAAGPDDPAVDPKHLIEQFPHGQLLIAGWKSISPAVEFRRLARERGLYVETYLAGVYPAAGDEQSRSVVIVPLEDVQLPQAVPTTNDGLLHLLPANSIVFSENELPASVLRGTAQSYAQTMAIWERLHAPFVAASDKEIDPQQKMDGYRMAIRVDYACELAHQRLSDTARIYARHLRAVGRPERHA